MDEIQNDAELKTTVLKLVSSIIDTEMDAHENLCDSMITKKLVDFLGVLAAIQTLME